jgi:rhodanese-related sulfurtransferase
MMSFDSIAAPMLAEQLKQPDGCILIDVRTPGEYQGVHVRGAINLPIDSLDPDKIRSLGENGKKKIYVLCQSGGRSRRACQTLADAGVEVVNVDGGTSACISAGLPIVRGKGVMAMDRQVRIAAGSMVVLGVALGLVAHPAFHALALFVGSGLVFSGVTNTCGMAMVLARMPWNQVKSKS